MRNLQQEQFENFIHSRGFEDYADIMDFIKNEKIEIRKFMPDDCSLEFLDHLESTLMFLKNTCTGEY